jgi:hypothetical protein
MRQYKDTGYWLEEPDFEMEQRPNRDDFDRAYDLREYHQQLAADSGKAIPGPNKIGTSLGYGLGLAGVLHGVAKKDPRFVLGGLATAGVTGLYHKMATPEARYNRYLDNAEVLRKMKNGLLEEAERESNR